MRRTEEGESVRGREREQRGRKRGEGTRGVRGRLGNASVEAGGGRGGIGARHRAASVRGEEDDRRRVGWAALGRSCWATRWASQVSPGGSALSFFLIFCNLFLICFNIKSFYKILEIIMGAF